MTAWFEKQIYGRILYGASHYYYNHTETLKRLTEQVQNPREVALMNRLVDISAEKLINTSSALQYDVATSKCLLKTALFHFIVHLARENKSDKTIASALTTLLEQAAEFSKNNKAFLKAFDEYKKGQASKELVKKELEPLVDAILKKGGFKNPDVTAIFPDFIIDKIRDAISDEALAFYEKLETQKTRFDSLSDTEKNLLFSLSKATNQKIKESLPSYVANETTLQEVNALCLKLNRDDIAYIAKDLKEMFSEKSKVSKLLFQVIGPFVIDASHIALMHLVTNLTRDAKDDDKITKTIEILIQELVEFTKSSETIKDEFKQLKKCKDKDPSYIFEPFALKIMQKANLTSEGIKAYSNDYANLIEEGIKAYLIEIAYEFYDKTIYEEHAKQKRHKTSELEGKEALKTVAKGVVQQGLVKFKKSLVKDSVQEMSFLKPLDEDEKKQIGQKVETIAQENPALVEAVTGLIQKPLETITYNTLMQLAESQDHDSKNAILRIEALFRELIKNNYAIDRSLERKISKLNKVGRPPEKEARKVQDIYKKYRAQSKELLRKAGYAKPEDLPVPDSFQHSVYKELSEQVVPSLFLDAHKKVIKAKREMNKEVSKRSIHAENLKRRFGSDKIVETARPFAKILLKTVESLAATESEELANKGVMLAFEKMVEENCCNTECAQLILKHKTEVASWLSKQGLDDIDSAKQTFGKALEDELEAFFIRLIDQLTENVEKIEKDDPKKTFLFAQKMLQELHCHLVEVNKITKEDKKSHMYMVDPLKMVREFERRGLLDPAMAGYTLLHSIQTTEAEITTLKRKIELKVGNVKTNEKRLESLTLTLAELLKEVSQKANRSFYNEFTQSMLKLSGITTKEELPGPQELQDTLWEMLHSNEGGAITQIIFEKSFEPMMLDKYLKILLETVNESLQEPFEKSATASAVSDEDKIVAKLAIDLLHEARKTLPGTVLGTLHRIEEMQSLPANIIADAVRASFQQYSLNRLIESSLIKGAKACEELLTEPVVRKKEDLPQAQKERIEQNNKDREAFHKAAGETIYNGADRIKNMAIGRWDDFQKSFTQKVDNYFGMTGRVIKRILDPICHVLVIDCIVKPLFSLFNLGMSCFYWVYSKQVVYHAEHARKCITEVPIHANFGYKMLRLFQHDFAFKTL